MIRRAEQFSPHSVEKDKAILEAVGARLSQRGHIVTQIDECSIESFLSTNTPDFIFSMARLPETLHLLRKSGMKVVNTPLSVENSTRHRLQEMMAFLDIPFPIGDGHHGYWLKRGDAAAQTDQDVVYAPDEIALSEAKAAMRARGINDLIVSPHVQGDLIKFYGVLSSGFFRYFYPTDDGETKFYQERLNGQAHHYPFDELELQKETEKLASTVGLEIYGGDCIVCADGTWYMIDFNDWPSFSRCREDAADAIAGLIKS
jgi:hypothetical protein